ncbi:hypothetical protein L6R49_22810 [Myxococcota bacterium]|nr:hypothetical protein [Myxococcota bacterium]
MNEPQPPDPQPNDAESDNLDLPPSVPSAIAALVLIVAMLSFTVMAKRDDKAWKGWTDPVKAWVKQVTGADEAADGAKDDDEKAGGEGEAGGEGAGG